MSCYGWRNRGIRWVRKYWRAVDQHEDSSQPPFDKALVPTFVGITHVHEEHRDGVRGCTRESVTV